MLNLSTDSFLTLDEVKQRAKSIFTATAAPTVSDKFTHIPTNRVIEDMEQLGWGVVDAKEVKARKEGTKGFQKHLVVFRNPDVVINGADGDTVFPQILLTNSNDGKNAFTFTAGLFRMVCENGLVISTEQFNDVKMRHMGYTFEELQSQIREMVEQLPLTVESMNKMKQIQLTEEQAQDLAKKALTTRFTEEQVKDVLHLIHERSCVFRRRCGWPRRGYATKHAHGYLQCRASSSLRATAASSSVAKHLE